MKVSEIKVSDVANYLRLDADEYTEIEITAILDVAKAYISNYTGIPVKAAKEGEKDLDSYTEFYIAIMVLCQDMYDNRSLYVEKSNLNKVVETILGMHCINLL